MKKQAASLLAILLFVISAGSLFASSLQLLPEDSLGYVHVANISKTIDTVDKFIHEIDPQSAKKGQSLAQAFGQAVGNSKIKNKEQLEAETGIKMDSDLILFWPSANWQAKAYAYTVVDKEKILAKLKKDKGAPTQPITVFSGIEIYIFPKKGMGATKNPMAPTKDVFFFVDNYLVNCPDESVARKIINCYQGQSKSITSNPKYLRVKNSIREQEVTLYCNLESVVQMFLPMVQMFGGMFTQKLQAQQMQQQVPSLAKDVAKDQAQRMQNMSSAYLKLVVWALQQIETSGVSIHLGEKGFLIDNYIGFKQESIIQEFLVQKKKKLEDIGDLPSNSIVAFDSKINPDVFILLYKRLLENIDANMIMMNPVDFAEWKETVMKEIESNLLFMGNEMTFALVPGEGDFPFQIVETIEVTDVKKAETAYERQLNLMNLSQPFFSGLTKSSGPVFEIKERLTYKGVKIVGIKYNTSQMGLNMGMQNKSMFNLENMLWWNAVAKNKQIICLSNSSDLIKQTIDSVVKGNRSPLTKTQGYQAATRSLPDNQDTISYFSVVSYIKAIYTFTKPFQQTQCFDVMKKIDNASKKYYSELRKYPAALSDLYSKGSIKSYEVRKTGDRYILDKNTGKVTCASHGSLANPIPLKNVNDKFTEVMSYWQGDIDGIGLSSKNQNGGVTQSIDTPVEVFKSISRMIRSLAANKKSTASQAK